jgi:hypothetical protein
MARDSATPENENRDFHGKTTALDATALRRAASIDQGVSPWVQRKSRHRIALLGAQYLAAQPNRPN